MAQNSVSFSCQSKQVWRCCINFPHELTCQILTNKNIKIGHRAWPIRDHGGKLNATSSLPVITAWIFASEVSLIQNFNCAAHKHNIFYMNLKKKSTWACDHLKTSNLSADNFKKYFSLMGWHRSPWYVRWYWSADTLFWQLSIDPNIDVKYECNISFPVPPN